MRAITKDTTANCNIEIYARYLLSEPLHATCTSLSQILKGVSHDSVNRFLLRENFSPQDLLKDTEGKIDMVGGVISVDDMVLDKPYSDINKSELISYYYSGKHHNTVKGINIITLYYTDFHGIRVPINYRIIDPKDKKTKNELFREMLKEVLDWGFKPSYITGDSWYSSKENMKFITKYGIRFLFGIESNRIVSIEKGTWVQVQKIENWNDKGVEAYFKDFGHVVLFRQVSKDSCRYYVIAKPIDDDEKIGGETFKNIHSIHWNIEQFHRATKQLCNIEKFQVRKTQAVATHIFCSYLSYIKLELARSKNLIVNWYQVKKELFTDVIRKFISDGITGLEESKIGPVLI
jgi:hypothetical protein